MGIINRNPKPEYRFREFSLPFEEIKRTIEFFDMLDKTVIGTDPREKSINHGDTNPTNILFTNLSDVKDFQNLGEAEFTKRCPRAFLIDFELAAECSFIYDLAAQFYLTCDYPRNFSVFHEHNPHMESVSRTFLKAFYEGDYEYFFNGIIKHKFKGVKFSFLAQLKNEIPT